MGLVVWLPLTKDINNYGLYPCTVTDKGATYSSTVGKLGGSYMFNPESSQSGTNYLMLEATTADILQSGQSFSMACWFKLTGSLYSNGCGLITGNVYTDKGVGLLIYNASGSARVCVQMCFNGTEREWKPNMSTFTSNTWYHVCFTYEQPTRKLSLYVNGALVDTLTETRDWVAHTTQKIRIGNGTQGGWQYTLPGYMNDARIYDHCLSKREVHDLAQGLVLHYPLNDAYNEPTTNIVYGQTLSWSGLQAYTGSSKSGETYTVTVGTLVGSYTFGTARMNIPQSLLVDGTQYAISFKYKVVTGNGLIVVDQAGCDWCDMGFTSTHVEQVGDSYYVKLICPVRSTYNSTYHFMDFRFSDVNTTFQIWDVQLEAKDHVTPYAAGTRNLTTVYDCSGYGYNGTKEGTLTLTSNSPRYDSYMEFSNNGYIAAGTGAKVKDAITVCCWARMTTWSGYNGRLLSCTEGGGWNFEPGSGKMNFACGTGTSGNTYKSVLSTTTLANLASGWHHFAGTYDGFKTKIYIDGVLENTNNAYTTKTPLFYNSTNGIFVGAEAQTSATTPVGSYFTGGISDVRIYATALSEADIKELYDTAATIDKGGNFHSFEFCEEDLDKGLVQKTGEVKTNDFIEKLEYLYLPAGRWVSTGLTYAANDTCKAATVLRYDVSGSGRDLMGYSGTQYGYWGVTNAGAWEQHGTFSYTDADITKKNTISYERQDPYGGTYQVGALNGSYSVRNKYIYSVKLWKNGTLERDMVPVKIGNDYGLYDIVTYTFYPCNNNTNVTISSDPVNTTIFKRHIDTNQLLEK